MEVVIATGERRLKALALEREIFQNEHGHSPPLEESATYFVAVDNSDNIVASFRMLGPSERPFDFEAYFPDPLFLANSRVGLIGRLCVHPDHRSISKQSTLLQDLLHSSFTFALEHGFSEVAMYTFPPLCRFYERGLFGRLGISFYHPDYGRDMELMSLNIAEVQSLITDGDRRATALYAPAKLRV